MKIYLIVLILVVKITICQAQTVSNLSYQSSQDSVNDQNKKIISIQAGFTFSSLCNENSQFKLGYTFGTAYQFLKLHKMSISSQLNLTCLNNDVFDLKGYFYDTDTVKNSLYDMNTSILFMEIRIPIEYRFTKSQDFSVKGMISPIIFIALKDYSTVENRRILGAIHEYDQNPPAVDGGEQNFIINNSGFGFGVGITFQLNRTYCSINYSYYNKDIMKINNIYYYSLNLGYYL